MRGLLDDELLDGPHEVSTWLRPVRTARAVDSTDFAGVLTRIEHLCQVWGGACRPLIPVEHGQVPDVYTRLLLTEVVDHIAADVDIALPPNVEQSRTWDTPMVVAVSGEGPADWPRPVQVVELAADDPWRPVYTAVLGTLPVSPDPRRLEADFLRPDLTFEELFPVERVSTTGSLPDLVARLEKHDRIKPRELSNFHLAYGMEPDTGYFGPSKTFPSPFPVRRAAGPNIIVAVSPGSVEDLALLWNLRAAHGDSRVLPIGIPLPELTREALRTLTEPGKAAMFGFSGGRCHLTSASVPVSRLGELAGDDPRIVIAAYEDLLTFGPAPGRPGTQVGFWTSGRTRLSPLGDADRDVLRPLRWATKGSDVIIDVRVRDRPLPTDATMRGPRFGPSFRGGAAQASPGQLRRGDSIEVSWPPSWTCLAAVARSRGLLAKPSEAGLAAVTLLRSLGSIDEVGWLLHPPLIDLLYRLGERSGMSWWKKRWTHTHKQLRALGVEDAVLEQAARDLGRDDPAIAPSGEGRDLAFTEFRTALGGDTEAASRWVQWAERRHLLVRGAPVTCTACGARSWLPMGALPPPVVCAGCGREIDQPFPPSGLSFTYRLGEPLRRVLETDSLGHLLALRWFVELFDYTGLVGAHPGVTFTDPVTGKDVGEADVVLLFPHGELVPVEVKRRIAGVDPRTLGLMDTLAEVLEAPWDALVVTQPARDCPELASHRRDMPARCRFLLTDDQLHDDHVFWSMGADPFAWAPRTAEEDQTRQRQFVRTVRKSDMETPRDYTTSLLLDIEPG